MWKQRILGFIASLISSVIVGGAVITQFNVAALGKIGVNVPLTVRLQTTAQDILGLAPLLLPIFGVGFFIAFIVAGQIDKRTQLARAPIFMSAGFVSVLTINLVPAIIFSLVPLAPARSLIGLIAISLSGAVAGYVYTRLHPNT